VGKYPVEGQCLYCRKTFAHPVRKQGGGRYKKYCSHNCSASDWTHKYPTGRKAIVTRYDTRPENKKRKAQQQRLRKLRENYGWTEAAFEGQLRRQQNSCRGCLATIDRTACVDHDHKSGIVRGLLCTACNWALGHVRDNPSILYRLAAHLDHTLNRPVVYLMGSMQSLRIPVLAGALRERGYDVFDDWISTGKESDENWQKYEALRGRSYRDALNGRHATNVFLYDRAHLDVADIAVLVMPAGKSAMLELGYAKGRGKPAYIFLDGQEPGRFDIMPNLADRVIATEEELFLIFPDLGPDLRQEKSV